MLVSFAFESYNELEIFTLHKSYIKGVFWWRMKNSAIDCENMTQKKQNQWEIYGKLNGFGSKEKNLESY